MRKNAIKTSIFLALIVSISILGGYFYKDYFAKPIETKKEIVSSVQKVEKIDVAKETIAIRTLVKTYLVSSVEYDWDTIKSLSTGDYKKELTEKVIPNFNKLNKDNKIKYVFNPRSVKTEILSLNTTEAILNVSYIITKGDLQDNIYSQENIKLFLVKENNVWKIFSVTTK